MLSIKRCILLAVILLVITQATKFENKLIIKYDNKNFTITMHDTTVTIPAAEYNFSNIGAKVQHSTAMRGGITFVQILDAENKIIYKFHKPTLYIFGRELLGNMLTLPSPYFNPTFGDWFMDQFDSPEMILYDKKLPPEFTVHVTFVGRGRKSIFFEGDRGIWIGFSDGYIDNSLGYCTEACSSINLEETEPVLLNIMRIINLFSEAALVAVIIFLITSFALPVKK